MELILQSRRHAKLQQDIRQGVDIYFQIPCLALKRNCAVRSRAGGARASSAIWLQHKWIKFSITFYFWLIFFPRYTPNPPQPVATGGSWGHTGVRSQSSQCPSSRVDCWILFFVEIGLYLYHNKDKSNKQLSNNVECIIHIPGLLNSKYFTTSELKKNPI